MDHGPLVGGARERNAVVLENSYLMMGIHHASGGQKFTITHMGLDLHGGFSDDGSHLDHQQEYVGENRNRYTKYFCTLLIRLASNT